MAMPPPDVNPVFRGQLLLLLLLLLILSFFFFFLLLLLILLLLLLSQQEFTCSKPIIETLAQGVKFVQS